MKDLDIGIKMTIKQMKDLDIGIFYDSKFNHYVLSLEDPDSDEKVEMIITSKEGFIKIRDAMTRTLEKSEIYQR